jgi:hypothetical protein
MIARRLAAGSWLPTSMMAGSMSNCTGVVVVDIFSVLLMTVPVPVDATRLMLPRCDD